MWIPGCATLRYSLLLRGVMDPCHGPSKANILRNILNIKNGNPNTRV